MIFNRKHNLDTDNREQRLKLQYQAMIQQGLMAVIGIVLMVMGFREGAQASNGVIMILCGCLLVLMGVSRLYLCYRLFHDDFDENDLN